MPGGQVEGNVSACLSALKHKQVLAGEANSGRLAAPGWRYIGIVESIQRNRVLLEPDANAHDRSQEAYFLNGAAHPILPIAQVFQRHRFRTQRHRADFARLAGSRVLSAAM